MSKAIKVAIVGLDTSHSIEFTRRIQAPECPDDQRVAGLRVTGCLRFETPFQNTAGLEARQKQLEAWGVRVTTEFDAAVSDCDAILMEINDPAPHLAYFTACAALGKPVFLDKPLADTVANGRAIAALAAAKKIPLMSCSSLRFVTALADACAAVPAPAQASFFGALGKAAAGSSLVWYGVHAFEMLERAMGRGAVRVTTRQDGCGAVCVVDYPGGRRGVVELANDSYLYGGALRGAGKAAAFVADFNYAYKLLLIEIERFFRTGKAPLTVEDALETTAMLEAAQQSLDAGKPVDVEA